MRLVPAACSPIEAVTRVPLASGRHGCHPLENAAQRFSGGENRKTYPADSRLPGLQEFQNSSLADSKQHSDGCSVWTAALRKASLITGQSGTKNQKAVRAFCFSRHASGPAISSVRWGAQHHQSNEQEGIPCKGKLAWQIRGRHGLQRPPREKKQEACVAKEKQIYKPLKTILRYDDSRRVHQKPPEDGPEGLYVRRTCQGSR